MTKKTQTHTYIYIYKNTHARTKHITMAMLYNDDKVCNTSNTRNVHHEVGVGK